MKSLSQVSVEKIEKDQTQHVVFPYGLHCAIFDNADAFSAQGNKIYIPVCSSLIESRVGKFLDLLGNIFWEKSVFFRALPKKWEVGHIWYF